MPILVQRRRGSGGRFSLGRVFGEFMDRSSLTGLLNRSDQFPLPVWGEVQQKWSDQFGLPAAVSCVFALRVCCGCWLFLAPRFSSTSVAAWTWQEKLAEVHEWNRVHRPNSWIEILSAPIHSPPLWFAISVMTSVFGWWKPTANIPPRLDLARPRASFSQVVHRRSWNILRQILPYKLVNHSSLT
jgi:hypothetical protein